MLWTKKKFKRLKQFWYDKLKREGFVDIEDPDYRLYHSRLDAYRQIPEPIKSERLDYYLKLGEHVEEGIFDNELDHLVMAYFAEGCTYKHIIAQLEKIGKKRHRKTLMFIRRKYEHRWGLKYWKTYQLFNSNDRRAMKAKKKP